jgi:hypothetical protein
MNLFHMLFGKTSSGKKTRKARYNKSYKKGKYNFKQSKSRKNKYTMKGG